MIRLIHLSTTWTILLDFAAWFVIHLGFVFIAVQIPVRYFDPKARVNPGHSTNLSIFKDK